jgi:hypothetical protein
MSNYFKENNFKLTEVGKNQLMNKARNSRYRKGMTKNEKKIYNSKRRRIRKHKNNIENTFGKYYANEDIMDENKLKKLKPEDLDYNIDNIIDEPNKNDLKNFSETELGNIYSKINNYGEFLKKKGNIGSYKEISINNLSGNIDGNSDYYTLSKFKILDLPSEDIENCINPFILLRNDDGTMVSSEHIISKKNKRFTTIKNIYDFLEPLKFGEESNLIYKLNDYCKGLENLGCKVFHDFEEIKNKIIVPYVVFGNILVLSILKRIKHNNNSEDYYKWLNYCFYNCKTDSIIENNNNNNNKY